MGSPSRSCAVCVSCVLVLLSMMAPAPALAGHVDDSRLAGVCPTHTTSLPTPMTLTVGLQRPNAPAPALSWAIPVELGLYAPGDPDTICHHWSLTLDQYGHWSGIISFFTGTYDVRLRGLHTLRNVKQNVVIDGPGNIDMGTLLEGDANADNIVDIVDFARLRMSYFLESGVDAGFNPTADFDESDFIDILDFGLLRGNYFAEGDIPVVTTAQAAEMHPSSAITMTLAPDTYRLEMGEITEFAIVASAGSQLVQGADVELYYDPAVVEIVDTAGNPVATITPGSAFTTVLQNHVDRVRHRILFSAGNFDDLPTGDLEIARLHLRGVGPGPAGLSFGSRTAAIDENYVKLPLNLPSLNAIVVTIHYSERLYLPLGLQD